MNKLASDVIVEIQQTNSTTSTRRTVNQALPDYLDAEKLIKFLQRG